MRCFTAIVPPDEIVSYLHARVQQTGIPSSQQTPPEKYHLTLRFSGEADELGIERLDRAAALAAAQHSQFSLRVSGAGTFDSAPVIWLGVDGDVAAATALWRSIQMGMAGIGDAPPPAWDDAAFCFRPHLTIAHVDDSSVRRRREMVQAAEAIEPSESWTVGSFALFVTHLDGQYECLHTYELTG